LRVTDLQGVTVWREAVTNRTTHDFELTSLPTGTYVLSGLQNDSPVFSQKLVVNQ